MASRDYSIALKSQAVERFVYPDGSVSQRTVNRTSDVAFRYALGTTRVKPKREDLLYSPTKRSLQVYKVVYPHTRSTFYTSGGSYVGIGPVGDRGLVTESVGYYYYGNHADLHQAALLDALTQLKESQFNGGVALAEARSLADDVSDKLMMLNRIARDVRSGRYRKAYDRFRRSGRFNQSGDELARSMLSRDRVRGAASAIPNSWLYYNFALIPTANDITGAQYEFLTNHIQLPSWSFFQKGYAKRKEQMVVPYDPGTVYSGRLAIHREIKESVRVKLVVRPRDQFLQKLSRIGATNPPEAVWNGLPFSWLADYFVGVGDWLSVLDVGVGYDIWPTWESSYRLLKTASYEPYHDDMPWTTEIEIPGSAMMKVIVRDVVSGVYGPIGAILPKVNPQLSVTRIANLASVLSGLVSGFASHNTHYLR